jgi:hypothetical protein
MSRSTEARLCRMPTAAELLPTKSRSPERRTTSSLADLVHQERADPVEQRDARLDEDQRAEVRIAAADRRRRVDHGGHPRGHEPLGGHTVEVLVVDHGDVAGARTRDQVLRPPVDARDARLAPTPVRPAAGASGLGRGRVGLLP